MDFSYFNTPKIAVIADWLIDFWWAELVISHLLELYPEADIYTSVCYMDHPMLAWRRVYTSWIQKIPFLNRKHKLAGILRPFAFRSFDLSAYDVIISSSSAESKHAGYTKKKVWAKHFCYCHTPTRYYWSHAKEYEDMMEFGLLNPLVKWVFRLVKWWMQKLDLEAVAKVDYFIANSKNTQARIEKYYQRESTVIYPGIDIPASPISPWEKKDFFIALGRCIPYKKFDLLVETFNINGKPLVLCTSTDTPFFRELRAKSKSNIEWKFRTSNEEKNILMREARAFLFPPLEDFWLAPLEAMAVGTPVIAYGEWWALETVEDGVSGIFFDAQTPASLEEALRRFETTSFDSEMIRDHAEKFSKEKFQQYISQYIENHV